MALFPFGKKDPIERLKTRNWSSTSERDALIEEGLTNTRDQKALVELLFMDEREVQRGALRRLKAIATPATLELFIKASRNQSLKVVQALSQPMSRIVPENSHSKAIAYVDSKDTKLRKVAEVYLLSCPPSPAIVAVGKKWLEADDHLRARRLMVNIERSLKDRKTDYKSIKDLTKSAFTHPNEHVRHIGWRILASQNNPADIGTFIEAISQETYNNQNLLADAITELASHGSTDVADQILPLLSSNSAVLRTTSINVLRRLQNPDDLIKRFIQSSRSMPPIVRERTLQTLGDLGDKLIEPLLTLMEDENAEICMLAITMASSLGEDLRMVKPLIKALRAKEWWVQATAAETLGSLGDPSAIEPLKKLLSDSETVWTAIGALATIAMSLSEAGNNKMCAAALNPLLGILKEGQRQVKSENPDNDEAADLRLEVINSLRPMSTVQMQEVMRRIAQNDRDKRVRLEALSAASYMARTLGAELKDEDKIIASIKSDTAGVRTKSRIDEWLSEARQRGASDLHVAAGYNVMMRCFGQLMPMESVPEPLGVDECAGLLRQMLTAKQAAVISRKGQLNLSHTVEGAGRFRVNIFSDYHGLNAVFRIIPEQLPTIQDIGLPAHFSDVQYWHQGLLLVCGSAGSGKTTTLTALINLINETRESHIITIEDPIEYVHNSRRSLVNQRELGFHTKSYARALRGALRQDPDVIVIGELNDHETISLALEASETGHLVIGTLNCNQADAAVDRFVNVFSPDEQNQIRLSLSEALKGVIAQTLLPGADGTSMAAVFEVLMGTNQVSNIIREGKTTMLESIMQTGQAFGMQTFDDALMNLVSTGKITSEMAAKRAVKPELFSDFSEDSKSKTPDSQKENHV